MEVVAEHVREAGRHLQFETEITPEDSDVFLLYDAFSNLYSTNKMCVYTFEPF